MLLKPSFFNKYDRWLMNMHPSIGAKFLATRYPDDRVTEIVLQHHERLDGSGYPAGLKGDDLSLMVRIVNAADIYEALIARRPYKAPKSPDRAIRILWQDAENGKLDSNVVSTLARTVEEWDPLTIRRPSFGDIKYLESFKQVTYFREPMCSFYNYRYLLTLDRSNEILLGPDDYNILYIDFKGLFLLNQQIGHLKVDQLLDGIGEKIQMLLNYFSETNSGIPGETLLFRRGSGYIVFISYPRDTLKQVISQIQEQVAAFSSRKNIKAVMIHKSFPCTCSLEEALNSLLETSL
ncbi:MAG TPA: HD domain-containing protein [Thermodesulfobacteriaceae bacterium]|nr:HD domain-containing protein [Thermodesulfobacteriaceae bacterium]